MRSLPRQFHLFYAVITGVGTLILAYQLIYTQWTTESLINLLIFAFIAVVSESLPVALPGGGSVTVSFTVFLAAVISFQPGIALAVAAAGALLVFGKAGKEQNIFKRVFNASQYVISLFVSVMVLHYFDMSQFTLAFRSVGVYLVVSLVYAVINMTAIALTLGLITKKSAWSIWLSNMRWALPNFLALAPLGLALASIYANYGSLGLILLSLPLLLSRHSFQLYMNMRENYFSTIEALVKAVEAKDRYTKGHSERVAKYSLAIARELHFSEEKIQSIKYAGILHDLGKIGISERVLNSEDILQDDDWQAIRSHPVIGEDIIKDINFLYKIGPGVRHHHEKFDGRGYPDGLAGEQIPLEARIIAVADTYDAMTSDRIYRRHHSQIEALQELRRVAGTQLDPELVGVFCRVVTVNDHAEYIDEKDSSVNEVVNEG